MAIPWVVWVTRTEPSQVQIAALVAVGVPAVVSGSVLDRIRLVMVLPVGEGSAVSACRGYRVAPLFDDLLKSGCLRPQYGLSVLYVGP